MSDYYSIDVIVRFGVLADSREEAERLAAELAGFDESDIPARAYFSIDAYRTPNQADYLKAEAVNQPETEAADERAMGG